MRRYKFKKKYSQKRWGCVLTNANVYAVDSESVPGLYYVADNYHMAVIRNEDAAMWEIDKTPIEAGRFIEEVDWAEVAVDTPILVSNDNVNWCCRHFAKYEDNMIYAWGGGCTSYTTNEAIDWHYAKLAEVNNE